MKASKDIDALAEQVKNLSVSDKLRLAIGLIERDRLDLAEGVIEVVSLELAGHRLLNLPSRAQERQKGQTS